MCSDILLHRPIAIDKELTLALPEDEEQEFAVYKVILSNRDHLLPWMDWIHQCTFLNQKTVFKRWKEYPSEKGFERILYFSEQPIGSAGIRLQGHGVAEIGYWIAKDYTGKGIMTKTAGFLTQLGFSHYGLHRVEIHCAKENKKSANVAKRLGYRHEATLRERLLLDDGYHDLEIYGILRNEWEDRNGQIPKGE